MGDGRPADLRLRTAEVVASLCLATDLGMAFPFEHGLQSTLIAMRLAEALGVDDATATQTYYACLLMYAGCTTDAHEDAEIFGGSLTEHVLPHTLGSQSDLLRGVIRAIPAPSASGWERTVQIALGVPRARARHRPHMTAICEVAETLAGRLGLPASIQRLFVDLTERWDGNGPLRRAKADEIPLALRIVHVARDLALQRLLHGDEGALDVVRTRAGRALDPRVVACATSSAPSLLRVGQQGGTAWQATLDAEPQPALTLESEAVDVALNAMGDFADLISPYLSSHSSSVAHLAAEAGRRCGLDTAAVFGLRHAGLVHDLGRVAVHPAIWQKSGPLSADEWEQVRLHPYHTERILSRAQPLAPLGRTAAAHHERLDGSGYHRGITAPSLPIETRLLAAADAFQAMTEPRPHRLALTPDQAGEELTRDASAGHFDAEAVAAILGVRGQPPPKVERPAGLTEREAQVVALLSRGLQTKQVARQLGISTKTADRHVQNAYAKIGVSTRAAVTLFAMEHGLVAWGELPMAGHPRPS